MKDAQLRKQFVFEYENIRKLKVKLNIRKFEIILDFLTKVCENNRCDYDKIFTIILNIL